MEHMSAASALKSFIEEFVDFFAYFLSAHFEFLKNALNERRDFCKLKKQKKLLQKSHVIDIKNCLEN